MFHSVVVFIFMFMILYEFIPKIFALTEVKITFYKLNNMNYII